VLLAANAGAGWIFVSMSQYLADLTKTDGIVALAAATVACLVLTYMMLFLVRRFPEQGIFQYSQVVLGRVLGTLYNVVTIAALFTEVCLIYLHSTTSFVSTTTLVETPSWSIAGVMVVIVAIAVCYGIESIVRYNEVSYWFVTASVILLMLGTLHYIRVYRLFPIIVEPGPVALGTLLATTYLFDGSFLLLFLHPFIQEKRKLGKFVLWSVVMSGIYVLLVYVNTLAVFGVDLTSAVKWPTYSLARLIQFGLYIENLEGAVVMVWISSRFVKISALFYGICTGVQQTLHLKHISIPALVLAPAMLYVSMLPENDIITSDFTRLWGYFALSILFLGPMLLLIIAIIRGKRGKPVESEN
jgi:spore germination protein (amino acid permease)